MSGVGGDFIAKTRSEQRLEWLFQMSRHRRLTNEEWEQVRRAERAIYQRIWRLERVRAAKESAA
jgi:hypothetical protein